LAQHEQDSARHPFHEEAGALVFDKPKSEEEAARQRREDEQHEFAREQVKTNKRLAWLTFFLVIGTFVGSAISILQANIARQAAQAAGNAVDTAKDSLQTSQRAYLVLGNPKLKGKPPVLTIPITNVGRVPAEAVRAILYEETVTFPEWKEIEGHWGNLLPIDVPPTTSDAADFSIITTAHHAEMRQINNGKQAIVVAGKIEYSDGFRDTPERTTWVCVSTFWNPETHESRLAPCNAAPLIPKIAAEIGYPKHYEGEGRDQTPLN
jgi:hypothetical protein